MRGFERVSSYLPWPRMLTAGTRCPRRGRAPAAIRCAGTETRAASAAPAVAKFFSKTRENSLKSNRNGSRKVWGKMSSRRRTQEAITRRAAVLLLCVRVRRRGGNENEHELVDEGIIKELSFLHTTTCACFTAARVLVLEHPLEHHLPARVSPLPLLVCTPSQQRAVGPIAACAPREIQQQRTHAIACSYCGPGRGPRKKPQHNVLARCPRGHPAHFWRVRLLVFLDEFSCESPHILAAVGATDADDVGVHAQQLEVETSR